MSHCFCLPLGHPPSRPSSHVKEQSGGVLQQRLAGVAEARQRGTVDDAVIRAPADAHDRLGCHFAVGIESRQRLHDHHHARFPGIARTTCKTAL